ncbi:hypothetical protein JCM21900_005218 [Sporobolomyces salmonicolor]
MGFAHNKLSLALPAPDHLDFPCLFFPTPFAMPPAPVLHRNHFRKDWQSRVKTWFDQPGKKHSRRVARQAKAVKAGLRPTELLRPAVRCPTQRYNRKLRAGRGFTKVELKAAGIRSKEALSIGIPVDHRRRNRSEEGLKTNVERLQAYKARLVVFPKKAGKVKKGDTEGADKSTDRLSTLSAAFPIPAGMTAEAPREITAEEKEFSAFTSLRKARSDARLVGVRAERKRKAEEEEAAKKKTLTTPLAALCFSGAHMLYRKPESLVQGCCPRPPANAVISSPSSLSLAMASLLELPPPAELTTEHGDTACLSYQPLDPAAIEAAMRSEKSGAVVSFVGYTRDNFQGRTVTHLLYESYVPLALKTLHHLLLEARALPAPPPLQGAHVCCPPPSASAHLPSHHHHDSSTATTTTTSSSSSSPSLSSTDPIEINRIHISHLLGPSPPRTPSIVIAVASPHRREAFWLTEWLLEKVKERVQVWKREYYAPGAELAGPAAGEVFVGKDGAGPEGAGGRAHERGRRGGGRGQAQAREEHSRWKENFAPARVVPVLPLGGGGVEARPAAEAVGEV